MDLLLINQNPAISRLITLSAQKMGHSLKEISEIDSVSGKKYDIVLLDSEFYDETIIEELKNSTNCSYLVYIGARGSELPKGASSLLEKPFLPTDFVSLIESLQNTTSYKQEPKSDSFEDFASLDDFDDDELESVEISENFLDTEVKSVQKEELAEDFDLDDVESLDELDLLDEQIDEPEASPKDDMKKELSNLVEEIDSMPKVEEEPDDEMILKEAIASDLDELDDADDEKDDDLSFELEDESPITEDKLNELKNEIDDEMDDELEEIEDDLEEKAKSEESEFDDDLEEIEEAEETEELAEVEEENEEAEEELEENEELEEEELDELEEEIEEELEIESEKPKENDELDEFEDDLESLKGEDFLSELEADLEAELLAAEQNKKESKMAFEITESDAKMPEIQEEVKTTEAKTSSQSDIDELDEFDIKVALGEADESQRVKEPELEETQETKTQETKDVKAEITNLIKGEIESGMKSHFLKDLLKDMKINISISFEDK